MKIIRSKSKQVPWINNVYLSVLPIMALAALIQSLMPSQFQVHCWFKRWSGFPCPTCGATRCVQLMLKGSLLSAFETQPLVFVATVVLGIAFLYSAAAARFWLPLFRIEFEQRSERIGAGVLVAALIMANWLYLLIRS